jgi:hypothetical protein
MNAQTAMTKRPERSPIRGSLAGPAVLIGLGIVFLLNNLGYLGWASGIRCYACGQCC